MKYKTKPCVIEAIEFRKDNWEEVRKFTEGKVLSFTVDQQTNISYCNIETLEGIMLAAEGDFIIRGLRGEYYPCKPDVFHKKYEAVD